MFLLGHSCWSYLLSKFAGRRLNVNVPLYLALLSGIVADFDIYFQPYLRHHTYTHSVLVLVPVAILLTYRYKRLGAALSIGILSHLLTDGLVGTIPIFYPLTNATIGLGLGIPSLGDTLLEVGALAVTALYVVFDGDYRQFRSPQRESLLMSITLASIVSLSILFAGDNNISLAQVAFSRKALTAISLGHVIEGAMLLLGTLQGLRAYLGRKRTWKT